LQRDSHEVAAKRKEQERKRKMCGLGAVECRGWTETAKGGGADM
jgi:hypothetical protein